jgi:glucosamine--fructose-6-phosphate aminotransferase (isomerizing)
MCGIVAYKGTGNSGKILLRCIKNLEYRGYDSIGMAVKKGNSVDERKDIGKIDAVDKRLNFENMEGEIGIAHTRWATTGSVTKENSHPHHCNRNRIYAVHNGIIENYQELREELTKKGVKFNSSTDSEVVPQMISLLIEQGEKIEEAIRKTLMRLEGSYALAIISKDDERIFFARRDSPLVIGEKNEHGESSFFIASDTPAFLEYTNKIMYVENDVFGFIDKEGVSAFRITDCKRKENKIETITWGIEEAKKGRYEHFMIKEINDQPATIKKAIEQDPQLIKGVVKCLKEAYGIFFVGCGTSYHAAVTSSYIFSHIAKKHVNVVIASEFRNFVEFLTDKTVVVAISQSGETADVLDAVKVAKSKGAKVISIVNVMGSSLTRISDKTIMMNSGPEICVLSTKSYTSQLAVLLLLAFGLVDRDKEAKEIIRKASSEAERIVFEYDPKIKALAERIKEQKNLFLIGRDLAFPSALEGALKIKEVSYIHAEGFPGGELKHGTIALIEKGVPCIVLSTKETRQMILSNASEIKARGGFIIGIGYENNEIFDEYLYVDELSYANPLAMIIPVQLLAYYLALAKGTDPDKPRNLAKSVTVK